MMPTVFAVKNLTSQAVSPCLPYEFRPTAEISAEIRTNKKARQNWYGDAATVHQFYTGVEASNPNGRVSKNNPARKLHAIIGDFDLPLDAARIEEAVRRMKYPPAWIERSLGGNVRLIWTLARPLLVESNDFATFVLQQAKPWLSMELLPGLDAPALEDPTRLYCNGCEWAATGASSISELACQAFFVEAGSKYLFKDTGSVAIPLDIVEAECRKKFPLFSWPGLFELNSQGPSFWIADSASAASAILKPDGFFTFSAHASKPFYSFADILGAEFVKDFQANSIALATKDIYFCGKNYWGMNEQDQRFVSMSKDVLTTRLRVNCRVSTKHDKSGVSMLDKCLNHVHEFARVSGGAPMCFLDPGLQIFNKTKIVNTAPRSMLIQPSGVLSAWGASGSFPFISAVLDSIFDPAEPQLAHFLAWLQYFYKTALAKTPAPGQAVFLAGAAGIGKTLLGREIIGQLMGGWVDAARFMLGDVAFNSTLFEAGVWNVDDGTVSDSENARRKFSSYVKLITSNSAHEHRRKFDHSVMLPWSGRCVCTLNLDASSSRSLPVLDESTAEKISFFRGASELKIVFPERETIKQLLRDELPNLAKWLVDWKTPTELIGSTRYGVKAYHCSELLDKSHQAGRSAPFRELLVEMLTRWFSDSPKATEFRGSCTQILRLLHSDPLNSEVLRAIKIESVNRYMEDLSREAGLKCFSVNGDRRTRLWVVERFEK